MIECRWLPALEICDNLSDWANYESLIYQIFVSDFITTYPIYNEKKVVIRKHPITNDREEAFYHITCQDYLKNDNRVPDIRRCERIRWVRKFIEHYNCGQELCKNCTGMKVWKELLRGKERIHILLEEVRFMVVLEERPTYVLLITAFYLDREHTLQDKLLKYNRYK